MSIYSLERTGDAGELRRYLRESDSPAVRERAAAALGEVGEEEPKAAVNALIRTAMNDESSAVRAAAVDALDDIGGSALTRLLAALGGITQTEDGTLPPEALEAMLDHELAEVRMAAATVIGNQAESAALPAMLARLTDDDPRVRVRVAEMAGLVGDPRAIDPLSSLAGVAPAHVRGIVARSLGAIGGSAALEALEPLLVDEAGQVREAAVIALGSFEALQPVDRLIDRLDDDESGIRRAAATGLVDLLSSVPVDESDELRETVAETLSTTLDWHAIEALRELYEDSSDARRRRNAIWLLGQAEAGKAVLLEPLVDALTDEDETVRRAAGRGLLGREARRLEAELLDRLDSAAGPGREMLVLVLGHVGGERARRRLLQLLDEVEQPAIKERTIAALTRLDGGEPSTDDPLRRQEDDA